LGFGLWALGLGPPAAGEAIGQAPQNKSHPFRLASGQAFFFGLSDTLK
jgi:hypothetical protein